MSFLKKLAGAVLPAIGTAVAGPIGGIVGGALGGVFGSSSLGKAAASGIGTGVGNFVGGLGSSYGVGGSSYSRNGLSKAQMISQKNMYAFGANQDRQAALGQFKDRYDFIRSEGGTLTEALGVGAGSTAQGATTSMGNQAAQLATQNNQLAFEAQQRDADRQVQLSGQQAQLQAAQISANAQTQSAGISAAGSVQSAGLSSSAMRFVAQLTDTRERELLLARMGTDNLMATSMANKWGLSIDQVPTDEQFDGFLEDYLRTQGSYAREAEGLMGLAARWLSKAQELGVEPPEDAVTLVQGGDEFGVFEPGISDEERKTRAQMFIQTLETGEGSDPNASGAQGYNPLRIDVTPDTKR